MGCRCAGGDGDGGGCEVSGNMVALGDVAEFVRGINFKPDDVVPVGTAGAVACMRTKNVQTELDLSDVWAVDESFMRRDEQCLQEGDILVSSANSWNLVGKCSWIPLLPYRASFGGFVSVLRVKSHNLDRRYLYRWFSSEYVQETLRSFGQKTTNISNLNLGRCEKLRLPLPPLEEQRRIAAILDQAETLRTQRRAALAQLDSLTQSIFLDMFGDPAVNVKDWPLATLGDVIFSASDGPHVSPKYADSGIPFLSARHVRPGAIDFHDLKYLSIEDANAQWRKCKPQAGDLLYTKGGTTGYAAVVGLLEPFAIWVHIALLRPQHEKVNSKWLEAMLNSQYCYDQSQVLTHGIANRDLGLKRMVRIKMYLPPLPLQQTFAIRIQAIESLKATHRAALSELDALFASLQQRAFAGEL